MNVSIRVRDGEEVEQAIQRFRVLVARDMAIKWKRRRYGYYEKPSALRQKVRRRDPIRLRLEEQWARTGPLNAAGK